MKVIYLLLSLAAFISCSENKPALSATEKEIITKAVRQTLNDYYEDIHKEGLLAEFKYLDSSAGFYWVPPGFTGSISFDSVAATLRKNASSYKSILNSWDTLSIVPISHGCAAYTGRISSKIVDDTGRISAYKLIESGVMIKRNDQWKLFCGQTSLINP